MEGAVALGKLFYSNPGVILPAKNSEMQITNSALANTIAGICVIYSVLGAHARDVLDLF